MEISKYCYCKNIPTLVCLPGELYYVQCTCNKHGAYDYLGATRKLAIEAWNKAQHSRSQYEKGEK